MEGNAGDALLATTAIDGVVLVRGSVDVEKRNGFRRRTTVNPQRPGDNADGDNPIREFTSEPVR
ncbi:MAG: hypothetical protein N2037_07850, partial [Acidimicrobiales bacterium]|nr:hypothetical protein [Acidimicrobiales bacterium]